MSHQEPVFGVIGCGSIGKIHLEALVAAELPVIALADPSPEALEMARKIVPHAQCFTDWRDLLQHPGLTAVNICTASSSHLEIMREALLLGKNVLCEKTMTVNRQEAEIALKLPVKTGQVVQLGFMKRFFPATIWAKEHLPEIGEPLCATVRTFQGGSTDERIFNDETWKGSPGNPSIVRQRVSAGMLNMAGSHMLDLVGWFLGLPETISCHTWAPDSYDVDLHAQALFKMNSRALVNLQACVSTFHKTGFFGNGWDESIQIDGTKGRLELYFPVWNAPLDHPAKVRLYRESLQAWDEPDMPIVNPFQLEMESFAESCRTGAAASPSIRDGAIVDCWLGDCYESAAVNGAVRFRFDDR